MSYQSLNVAQAIVNITEVNQEQCLCCQILFGKCQVDLRLEDQQFGDLNDMGFTSAMNPSSFLSSDSIFPISSVSPLRTDLSFDSQDSQKSLMVSLSEGGELPNLKQIIT